MGLFKAKYCTHDPNTFYSIVDVCCNDMTFKVFSTAMLRFIFRLCNVVAVWGKNFF